MLTILEEKHPLAAQFIKFYAFSVLVTLLQYLLLTFLPGIFHSATNWCDIPCQLIHLKLGPVDTYVFNYPVTGDATGGMGYFAAFAVTLFIAQCVNFPMQRSSAILRFNRTEMFTIKLLGTSWLLS